MAQLRAGPGRERLEAHAFRAEREGFPFEELGNVQLPQPVRASGRREQSSRLCR